MLEALDERVGLRQMVGDDVGRLQSSQIGNHVTRADRCQLGAGLTDQPKGEIEMAHRCADGDDPSRWREYAGFVEQDVRIALPEEGHEPTRSSSLRGDHEAQFRRRGMFPNLVKTLTVVWQIEYKCVGLADLTPCTKVTAVLIFRLRFSS